MKRPTLQLVTPPATEPVSLNEAKDYLRVLGALVDDNEITRLLKAAREMAENYTRRAFITQTWSATYDELPTALEQVTLPRPNLISVTEVVYWDDDDNEVTVPADDYATSAEGSDPGWFFLRNPAAFLVREEAPKLRVTYTAGYGNADEVDLTVKVAIKAIVFQLFNHRANPQMPDVARNILNHYRAYYV